MPLGNNSIKEIKEDILTFSIVSEEEGQGPKPALPTEAREAPRRPDSSTPKSWDCSRTPRTPLTSPGPLITDLPRPILAIGGIGGASSWPGGHSCCEDRMRPFRSASAGAGMGSTSFQQDMRQVTIGPGGGGIFHGPEHIAGPSGARPPHLTSALGLLKSRAQPEPP